MIVCPNCQKQLTVEDNNNPCPNSPYKHGGHPYFVFVDVLEFDQKLIEKLFDKNGNWIGVSERVEMSLKELREMYPGSFDQDLPKSVKSSENTGDLSGTGS